MVQSIPDSIIRIMSPAVGEDGVSLPSRGAIQKGTIWKLAIRLSYVTEVLRIVYVYSRNDVCQETRARS